MARTQTPTAIQFKDGTTYAFNSIWQADVDVGRCVALYGKEGLEAIHTYQRNELLKLIKPNDTLTVVCTHVSSNGMSARFKVLIPLESPHRENGLYIRNVTRDVAALCGFKLSKHDEIVMGGCGYSKSFQIGYSLGRTLWPNGTATPHGTRNGEPDSDGGYALGVSSV